MAILLILAIGVLIGADQLVKYWAVHELKPKGSMEFIHIGDFKILDLTYVENDGAIFGSMSGQRWFLIGFTAIAICVGMYLMFRFMKKSKFLCTLLLFFVAGGIGNLIDRIRLSYVVDMFDIKLFKFAVFNVADIFVTCAEAMLIIYIIFVESKKDDEKKAESEKVTVPAADSGEPQAASGEAENNE